MSPCTRHPSQNKQPVTAIPLGLRVLTSWRSLLIESRRFEDARAQSPSLGAASHALVAHPVTRVSARGRNRDRADVRFDTDPDAEVPGCCSISGAASHAALAHPVTHENVRGRDRGRNRSRCRLLNPYGSQTDCDRNGDCDPDPDIPGRRSEVWGRRSVFSERFSVGDSCVCGETSGAGRPCEGPRLCAGVAIPRARLNPLP